ncbi:Putative UDP-glucuronate:xylan alpha-glucuronosyltransferase 3 [Apostasia shenzhenica]|uniref:Hexosyltransferase n=1 Tax=Apostasia shenzhenica TaxID=1088818 RepID=A0A2I0AG78_9ASPA|nr:Putative UDP-glucuronate:xylan alpha-glucuronosyltransferase 3 [Apostasia shenzhenica]
MKGEGGQFAGLMEARQRPAGNHSEASRRRGPKGKGLKEAFKLLSPIQEKSSSGKPSLTGWQQNEAIPRYASNIDIEWTHILQITVGLYENNPNLTVGLLNFNSKEVNQWHNLLPNAVISNIHLNKADKNLTWEELYPEWIDEEEETDVPVCHHLPNPKVSQASKFDLIAVKLPCNKDGNWRRDIARLHLQISAAKLAAYSAQGDEPVNVLLVTNCFPIPNLFACKHLVAREGNVWLYKPDLKVLLQKIQLPVGSCELPLPLKHTEIQSSNNSNREAYATILHSEDVYVCGAIVAAQSIRLTGSTRDLVILVDETIRSHYKNGLEAAGWKIRKIKRIRNPNAEKDAYNEWNYSKFRLWQLTEYDKIIFIDADLLVLRNIDFLFKMPEISATGNNVTLFNSGVMVIEPSNCTFKLLMDQINDIKSYNGGDQGYLNEIFTWWHRIPRSMNFLKHFWIGDEEERKASKNHLFGADPPVLYVLHYLGFKPWMCFRDYDCNWNVDVMQEFASDIAHERWWRVHDSMEKKLQKFCLLSTERKANLEWDRMQAEKMNYSDAHWKMKRSLVTDKCISASQSLNVMGIIP